MTTFKSESIPLETRGDGSKLIKLPVLTEEEKNIIDPIVAPTSGLRIELYDINEVNDEYFLPRRKFYLFLRVFQAISQKFKEMEGHNSPKILIVTDDRPSRNLLLDYCAQIFAFEGFEIYFQEDEPKESRVSSPYGAASVALYNDIQLIIVLTASHNELSWNGIKFYIDYPMPMSGDVLKEISKLALQYQEIYLKTDYSPIRIDAIKKNNDYIIDILSNIIDIKHIRGKNIIIWPYLGKAKGIVDLFEYYGAKITLIDDPLNPPNPIKVVKEDKLQKVMHETNSNIALLLDADRDRIALYIKQNGDYYTYIPNEIYSAMHNILAKDFNRQIINVRTIPSDLRGDANSFINILTGVGYKHLGAILYFLMDIEVEKSKIDTAILYYEDDNKALVKINSPEPLKERILNLMERNALQKEQFIIVMWEESGGHTINILNVSKDKDGEYVFKSEYPLIADKYPVPALVLITELICRGYVISEAIDFSIVGINQTIPAVDEDKIKIMKGFEENNGKELEIMGKKYKVTALSDNNNMIDIYQLKSGDSTIYFRPSGTGPNIRFYIFGDRSTYSEEIKNIEKFISENYN
ncbi:MAG: hypothetical protein ACTSR8_14830 [Promethearchaeota archaeon]